MHTDRSLVLLMGAGMLAVVSGVLAALAYAHQPMAPDGDPVLGTPQLIMFETDTCDWCDGFRRKAAKDYAGSEFAGKAPLRFMSVDDGPPPKKYRLVSFRKSPMLVLFDQFGRELDRIQGDPGSSDAVQSLVRRNLRRVAKS